ncbi:MAG: organic solvent tolerance protein OstA [Planctomycetota bacterium]
MVALAIIAAVAPAWAEVRFPTPSVTTPIRVEAARSHLWLEKTGRVWALEGGVTLEQGASRWIGQRAVLWMEEGRDQPTQITAYLEGTDAKPIRVELLSGSSANAPDAKPLARQQATHWFGVLRTAAAVEWHAPPPEPRNDKPGVYARAIAKRAITAPTMDRPQLAIKAASEASDSEPIRDANVQPAQFLKSPFETTAPPPTVQPIPTGFRSVRVAARQGAGLQIETETLPSGETAAVLSGGVLLTVTGLNAPGLPAGLGAAGANTVDRIEFETDRAVVWTRGGGLGLAGGQVDQSAETPLEVYLEGNIVVRQGERTILAERMYYDVRRQTGVVLDAELLTPLPEVEGYNYRGLVRLKADAIRQLDESRFVADNALFTTSRLEEPSYSLRSETVAFEDYQRPILDPLTGQPSRDPFTGAPRYERRQLAESQSNRVLIGDVPVLYWPTIATDLQEPAFYIEDFQIGNDAIFGTQVRSAFDLYELLGSPKPNGVDWTVSLDYLSERGLGYGTLYDYELPAFAGATGPARGRTDLWFIDENGADNLGFGRRDIVPEESFRGRAYWDHRQTITDGLLGGWIAQGEVGWISDRTFLEQYYERDWDERRDQNTGFRFRRLIDNQSLSVESNAKLNEFFTETQWLPRVDHWLVGQDLGYQLITWSAHSHVGYANLNPASTPSTAQLAGQFALFPWEAGVEGERAATRQEIALPIDLTRYGAPVKVVPYFLGELAHWGADLTGDDLQRAYLQTGVRASVPFWAVNPAVKDPIFNLDGLAHKVVFDLEASYADANRDHTLLPLYDEIEDNALEEIRRRLFFPTLPALTEQADPRRYLLRSGIQGFVNSPTVELADDLSVARVGMRHRLQTKRGAPGNQRVVDWLTLDMNASYFPEEDRDNLGEDVGLVDYDLSWHLGDRFTILSDGFVDLFTDGLQTFSGGVAINRPERGNAYFGYRSIRGPFNSDILTGSINYRLGPKWVTSATAVVDLGVTGNIGQSFALSRIGESLIFTVGANVDESKDNVGVSFLVEPRFLPSLSLTRKTGIDIPPAGAFGLE